MKMKTRMLVVAAALACSGAAQSAALLDLTGQGYYTYGNTNSYSLPISAYQYDLLNGGGTGPGNPYYVDSSPGQIKDLVVIYTGANGQDVTTNVDGFDDAYGTPNGSSPTFASIEGAVNVIDPGNKAGIANNDSNTWDASLLSLKSFLDGGNPLFLFNNNDTNADQNLAIWAKLWLTTPDGSVYDNRYLYLSNEGAAYGIGGTPLGDATLYNPGDVLPSSGNPFATDYVLSGGAICLDATSAIVACNDPGAVETINHNLGANQAAYAADLPLLNGWLADLFKLDDLILADYTLHLDLKLGCDVGWATNCDDIKIDNGYEQLFLASSVAGTTTDMPEPGVLGLVALGLLGAGMGRRNRTA